MNLQTKIPLQAQKSNQIDYHSNLLLLGSCFVENIGGKLDHFRFRNLQNPLGILFNPIVLERLILNGINGKVYAEDDVFFYNERWHCYDAHSKLSSRSKEGILHDLNNAVSITKGFIKESSHIFITLGTAWAYRSIEKNRIVANCHKVPQIQFKKELLSIHTISKCLQTICTSIHDINPSASVIFTVSPVRHLKDGFIQNQQSKAHLISAVHETLSQPSDGRLAYFPSYEIMMDELRDYRFYAEDMLHPNNLAVNYIWEKFKMTWIHKEAYSVMDEVDAIQKGLHHKPFDPNSKQHMTFIRDLVKRQERLIKIFPHITF